MNVLHVIPSFAPAWRYGGPIVAAVGLTRELARQGHSVTVATTNVDGPGELDVPLERPVDMDGVSVWYFPIQRPRWYHFSRPMGGALSQLVRKSDVVHIHSIFLWPTTAAAFWCRRNRVPYLIRPAGFLDPESLAKRYGGARVSAASRAKKWLYLKTLGRPDIGGAAGLHFTSDVEMESSIRLGLRPRAHVIPLGVDPPPAAEANDDAWLRRRFPKLGGKKLVLFLSRLDPVKGLEVLVRALGGLAVDHDDFALIIAGSGPAPYESTLRSLVDEHGLGDRTVFTGLVEGDDKWRVLRSADLFVLPSHHENFGVAVVEAMASGTPVVVSNRVNIHSEISAAGAGLVTDVDESELAAAVRRLLEDPALRAKMGQAGHRLAREKYSWERAASEVGRLYEEIAGPTAGRRLDSVGSAVE